MMEILSQNGREPQERRADGFRYKVGIRHESLRAK
jgi:hypothetical protein